MFRQTFRQVCGAICAVFATDEELNQWMRLISDNSVAKGSSEEALFVALLDRLDNRSIRVIVFNEEAAEIRSIVAEAIMVVLVDSKCEKLSRKDFSYRVADVLKNEISRKINRDTKRLIYTDESQLVPDLKKTSSEPEDELDVGESLERIDDIVRLAIDGSNSRSSVTNAEVLIAVRKAWLHAIRKVENRSGDRRVRAMSAAVKEQIAADLEMDINVVEAALKRYQRAVRRVREKNWRP